VQQQQRKTIVIHSPHSGRADQLEAALHQLERVGLSPCQIISINDLDKKPVQGPIWQRQGVDMVIAAGGDGLVGGVITHIAESELPLGILPLGTSNDTARTLSIPQDIAQAVDVLRTGKIDKIDLGMAQPAEQAPHIAQQNVHQSTLPLPLQLHGYFAHISTVGINVQFAHTVTDAEVRQRYRELTYPVAAFEVFMNRKALDLELRIHGLMSAEGDGLLASDNDPVILRCRAILGAVMNAPLFGGAFEITLPGASVYDGLLDIIVIEEFDLDNLASNLARFFRNQKPDEQASTRQRDEHNTRLAQAELSFIPSIHHLRAKSVIMSTSSDPQDITLDGEIRGQTPTLLRIADRQLHVIVPT
jgi:diacylglycerol kinase (ATP)